MSYNKTNWVDDSAPYITAEKLNNIENGIETNDNAIGDLSDLTTTANTDLVSAVNELDDLKATKDVATTSANGLMSASDKTKLNSITNNYNTSTKVVQFNIGDIKVVVGEVSYKTGSTAPYSTPWTFISPVSFTFGYVFCQPSSGNTSRQIQIRPNVSHFSGTAIGGIATSDIANYENTFTIMVIGV